MIKRGLQLMAMVVVGITGLAGIWWLASVRPGFLSPQRVELGFGWWKVSLGYRLLLGLDALLLAWAIGWTALSSLTRVSARVGAMGASFALRPPPMALLLLFVLHIVLPIVTRPGRTPALVLTEGARFSPAGMWLRPSLWVGGSVASLALLAYCAGLALWHISGELGETPHRVSASPQTASGGRPAIQVSRACLELVCGFAVLVVVPAALEHFVALVRPHNHIFQDGSLMAVWRYVTSPTRPGWVGFALGLVALSWSLGTGILAVVQGPKRRAATDLRRARDCRLEIGKWMQAWLLASGFALCVLVRPSPPPRLCINVYDGWWFGLDPWLAGTCLLVVALAVLFVFETVRTWLDRHGKKLATSSRPAATEQP